MTNDKKPREFEFTVMPEEYGFAIVWEMSKCNFHDGKNLITGPVHVIEVTAVRELEKKLADSSSAYEELQTKFASLQKERDIWRERVTLNQKIAEEFRAERDALKAENEKLRKQIKADWEGYTKGINGMSQMCDRLATGSQEAKDEWSVWKSRG